MTRVRGAEEGDGPAKIIEILHMDPDIERRQFGILDMQGRSAGHNGSGNSTASLYVPGHVGDYYFRCRATRLFSDQVDARGRRWRSRAKGVAFADHVMAAMEAADAKGGDKRCNCRDRAEAERALRRQDRARRLHRHRQRRPDVTDQVAQPGRLLRLHPRRPTKTSSRPENASPGEDAAHAADAWKAAGSKLMQERADRDAEHRFQPDAPDPWFATFSIIALRSGDQRSRRRRSSPMRSPLALPCPTRYRASASVATQAAANRLQPDRKPSSCSGRA